MNMPMLKVLWVNCHHVEIIRIYFPPDANESSDEIEKCSDDDNDSDKNDNDEEEEDDNNYHEILLQVKPVWLAEIGTRTAEAWDGTSWRSIPSLSRAKVDEWT